MRRPDFLDLVASLVHAARPPQIVHVDTLFGGPEMDELTGLTVTTRDGDVYRLRAHCTSVAKPALAPRPPVAPSLDSGDRRA